MDEIVPAVPSETIVDFHWIGADTYLALETFKTIITSGPYLLRDAHRRLVEVIMNQGGPIAMVRNADQRPILELLVTLGDMKTEAV